MPVIFIFKVKLAHLNMLTGGELWVLPQLKLNLSIKEGRRINSISTLS